MTANRLTILVIAIVLALVLVVYVSDASAHRVVDGDTAQRAANLYVRDHYCGNSGAWTCTSVQVPLLQCGLHSYCWHGVSHRECVKLSFWGCIKHKMRSSSGTVNGHTGKVVGYGEY